MYGLKHWLAALPLLLLIGMAQAGPTTVATCPGAIAGTLFQGAWLPCPAGVVYAVPAQGQVVATLTGPNLAAWMLSSNVLPTNALWVKNDGFPAGTWVSANTVSFGTVPPVPPVPPPVVVPPVPPVPPSQTLTFTLQGGAATVSWTAPLSNANGSPLTAGEITGYNVYQNTTLPVVLGKPLNATPLPAATMAYAVSGLTVGTYYFSVVALAGAVQSPPLTSTAMVIPTITVTIAPSAPDNFGIVALSGSSRSTAAAKPSAAGSPMTPIQPSAVTVTYSSSTP